MCPCFVLFCLVKESFVHNFGSDSDKMSYFVAKASVFCRRVLLRTCVSSLLPESHDIQAWVELMEYDIVPDSGKTADSEPELGCSRRRFASSTEFDACVGNSLYFLKIIAVKVFAFQVLSGCINGSLTSLLPRVFVRGFRDVLVAPFVRL